MSRMNTRESTIKGIVVGLSIITILLAAIGLYVWGSFTAQHEVGVATSTAEMSVPIGQAGSEILDHAEEQRSDDLSAIEADLTGVKLNSIDVELNSIEKELGE